MSEDADKYLSKDKASRFKELDAKGTPNLTEEEHDEHTDLMFEMAEQRKASGGFDIPFEGKCRRCGREFDSPIPEVTYPEGVHEIASNEWCPDCNALTMSVIFRGSSAYRKYPLVDPLRGGMSRGDI